MPLGDTSAYGEWIERETPSQATRVAVGGFIAELADTPWAAPSVPDAQIYDDRSEDEVRWAELAVPDGPVWVYYRQVHASGLVDLIAITNRPPVSGR